MLFGKQISFILYQYIHVAVMVI